ncbi:MAG TPA: 5-oxoprolinase subunit PxpB [Anaerolineales bacterium]|nr:5-oxoprolinase subunit PxpB [Anaerolineales bacterium]
MSLKPTIVPLGDSALLVQLGDEINLAVNQKVHTLASLVNAAPLEGLIETVPSYSTLLVHYDPLAISDRQLREWLREKVEQIGQAHVNNPRHLSVPVQYGGEYGVDLAAVADFHQLSVEQVMKIHASRTYIVYMMGFTPGFPYMGKLDNAIATPRLETPRTQVPAGTVAIAGSQTGIYPIDSPGGWRLIGYTPLRLFDPDAASPFLFSPGDEVRFVVDRHDT